MLGFLSVDDDPTQHLFHARLRPGTARDARGTPALLRRTVRSLRESFRKARILVRLDAGFAVPAILEVLDELRVDYLVAMAGNPVLHRASAESMRVVRGLAERFDGSLATWGETSYRSGGWQRDRRVIFKAEALVYPERELKENQRFVVTNLRLAPKRAWDLYCAGNEMDLYREWAMAVAHGRREQQPSRRFAAGIIALRPERDGTIAGYEGLEAIRNRYGQWIIDVHLPPPGTPTQPVEAGYMANAWIRMKHPDYDELRNMLNRVGETVRVRAG